MCVTSCFPELKSVHCDGEQEKKPNGGQHQLKETSKKPLSVQNHRYSRHALYYTHFCQTSTWTVTITTSSYSGIADKREIKVAINLPAKHMKSSPPCPGLRKAKGECLITACTLFSCTDIQRTCFCIWTFYSVNASQPLPLEKLLFVMSYFKHSENLAFSFLSLNCCDKISQQEQEEGNKPIQTQQSRETEWVKRQEIN